MLLTARLSTPRPLRRWEPTPEEPTLTVTVRTRQCATCGREYNAVRSYAAHCAAWYGFDPAHTPDDAPYTPYTIPV